MVDNFTVFSSEMFGDLGDDPVKPWVGVEAVPLQVCVKIITIIHLKIVMTQTAYILFLCFHEGKQRTRQVFAELSYLPVWFPFLEDVSDVHAVPVDVIKYYSDLHLHTNGIHPALRTLQHSPASSVRCPCSPPSWPLGRWTPFSRASLVGLWVRSVHFSIYTPNLDEPVDPTAHHI